LPQLGDTASAQGVEKQLVVVAEFEVLQTNASTESVIGEIQNVIRFVKRQLDLEQVQAFVESVNQAELLGHAVDGADTALHHAAGTVADLLMGIAGRELGPVAIADLSLVRAAVDAALADAQSPVYSSVHSKSLQARSTGQGCHHLKPRKSRKISSFS
jgi:hypothetical protein